MLSSIPLYHSIYKDINHDLRLLLCLAKLNVKICGSLWIHGMFLKILVCQSIIHICMIEYFSFYHFRDKNDFRVKDAVYFIFCS